MTSRVWRSTGEAEFIESAMSDLSDDFAPTDKMPLDECEHSDFGDSVVASDEYLDTMPMDIQREFAESTKVQLEQKLSPPMVEEKFFKFAADISRPDDYVDSIVVSDEELSPEMVDKLFKRE